MISLAKLSIRRPRAALLAWLIVAAALAAIGFGVSGSLSPPVTVVPGTQSSRAQQLAGAQFGPTQLIPILLEGPRAQLDRQGPPLVAALARRADTRVLSAWDAGSASAGLRPKPTAAMLVVSVDRFEKDTVAHDEPQIERLVARMVTAPVRSYITGQPSIDRAERDASLSSLRRDELIAVGVLFLLLLVGLRAPIAALLVTAVGAISVLAGFGEVALLGRVLALDPVGVAAGTMTGLALGVGFALMILDRFHREELPDNGRPRGAATAATLELATTGRAVLIGGTALIIALALVAMIGPTQLMVSVGAAALTCAAFATGGAVVVMPAALVLLGRRIDLLRFPAPPPLAWAWTALVDEGRRVTRRPVLVGMAATAVLAVIAVPALALTSGPPDVSQLPSSAKARVAFEEVSRVMGPGWATPYDLIVVANDRPLTTPALLSSIHRLQLQIAKEPTVDSVTGPGAIDSTSTQLSTFGPQLRHSATVSDQSKADLLKLIKGLQQAGSGSTQLQVGLQQAAAGSGQLHSGGGQARSGAGELHAGLAQARTGSGQLAAGLGDALSGAVALRKGASKALAGATLLARGLGKGAPQVSAGLPAVGQLATTSTATVNEIRALQGQAADVGGSLARAIADLRRMSAGTSDPSYHSALAELQAAQGVNGTVGSGLNTASSHAAAVALIAAGVKAQVNTLAPQLTSAAAGAAALEAGIKQLRDGNAQLASGLSKLSSGGQQLHSGLGQLTAGAGALEIGLGQLASGAGQLASGLEGGVGPAGQLTTGLGTMQAAVVKARGQIPSTAQLHQLEVQSPGIFNSGYFVLAAVEGATRSNRNAATFTINLLRGGTAGQIVVVSKYRANDRRTAALGTQLVHLARGFATRTNTRLALGGPAGNLADLTNATRSRIWIDVAALAAAMLLVLGLALRAVLLPAIATACALLTTAAAFGVLQVLFGGPDPLLSGPGYLDPITIISVFTIAIGITAIYATLLLTRTREAYLQTGQSRDAVLVGLRETAASATGAGLVMIAALIPFTLTDLLNIRALGIGVAVAVLLDIAIVRPVLLPAAAAALGRHGWWPTRPPRQSVPPRAAHRPPEPSADTEPAPVAPESSPPVGATR